MIVASISVVEIIVLVGLVVIALLFAGGMLAVSRRRDKLADSLLARIEAADAALADARAQDRGWERATIEAAARAAVGPAGGAASSTSCRSSTSPAPTPTRPSSACWAPMAPSTP